MKSTIETLPIAHEALGEMIRGQEIGTHEMKVFLLGFEFEVCLKRLRLKEKTIRFVQDHRLVSDRV